MLKKLRNKQIYKNPDIIAKFFYPRKVENYQLNYQSNYVFYSACFA